MLVDKDTLFSYGIAPIDLLHAGLIAMRSDQRLRDVMISPTGLDKGLMSLNMSCCRLRGLVLPDLAEHNFSFIFPL